MHPLPLLIASLCVLSPPADAAPHGVYPARPAYLLLAEAGTEGGSGLAGAAPAVRRSPRDRLGFGVAAALGGGLLAPSLASAAVLQFGPRGTGWSSSLPSNDTITAALLLGYGLAASVGPLAVYGAMDGGAWRGRALMGTLLGYGGGALLGAAGIAVLAVLGSSTVTGPFVAALWILAAVAPSVGTLVALATAPELPEQASPATSDGQRLRPSVVALRF